MLNCINREQKIVFFDVVKENMTGMTGSELTKPCADVC